MPDLTTTIRDIEAMVHRNDHSRVDDLIAWLDAGGGEGDIDAWLGQDDAATDTRLAWAAAWALGCLGVARAVPALEEELRRYRYHSLPGVAVALLKIGPDRIRKRTIIAIARNRPPLSMALGMVGRWRPDLVALVKPFCRSFDPRVRRASREFVEHHAELQTADRDSASASPDESAAWLQELDTRNYDQFDRAVMKLARCESIPPKAAAALREALAWDSGHLPYDATIPLLLALARTGDPTGMEIFLERLDAVDARFIAVNAIEILLNSSAAGVATDALVRLLEYPDALLCIWESHDLNWTCDKCITDVDLKPVKVLAAAELECRGVVVS